MSDTLYEGPGGAFFVSSERAPEARRRYSVRKVEPDASIQTVGKFQAYATYAQATRVAQRLAKGGAA